LNDLHYMTAKPVVSEGLTGLHTTGCFGGTRLVPYVPGSS